MEHTQSNARDNGSPVIRQRILDTFEAKAFFDMPELPINRRFVGRRKEDQLAAAKATQIKQMVRATFNGARASLITQTDREQMDAIAQATMVSIERAIKQEGKVVSAFQTHIKHFGWRDLYPNVLARACVWLYNKCGLDTVELKQHWYHSILPFKISYLVSGPDYNLEQIDDYYERLKHSGVHYIARLEIPHDEVEVKVVEVEPADAMIHLDMQVSKSGVRFEHSLPDKHHAFASRTRTN